MRSGPIALFLSGVSIAFATQKNLRVPPVLFQFQKKLNVTRDTLPPARLLYHQYWRQCSVNRWQVRARYPPNHLVLKNREFLSEYSRNEQFRRNVAVLSADSTASGVLPRYRGSQVRLLIDCAFKLIR